MRLNNSVLTENRTSSIDSVVDLMVVTTVLFLKSWAEMNTKMAAIVMEAVTMMAQM